MGRCHSALLWMTRTSNAIKYYITSYIPVNMYWSKCKSKCYRFRFNGAMEKVAWESPDAASFWESSMSRPTWMQHTIHGRQQHAQQNNTVYPHSYK